MTTYPGTAGEVHPDSNDVAAAGGKRHRVLHIVAERPCVHHRAGDTHAIDVRTDQATVAIRGREERQRVGAARRRSDILIHAAVEELRRPARPILRTTSRLVGFGERRCLAEGIRCPTGRAERRRLAFFEPWIIQQIAAMRRPEGVIQIVARNPVPNLTDTRDDRRKCRPPHTRALTISSRSCSAVSK